MTEKGLEEGKHLCRWGEGCMETCRCNCCSACLLFFQSESSFCNPEHLNRSTITWRIYCRTLNQAFREFPLMLHMNSIPCCFFCLVKKCLLLFHSNNPLAQIQSWSLKQMMTFRETLDMIRKSKKQHMYSTGAAVLWLNVFSVGRPISATSLSTVIGPQSWIGQHYSLLSEMSNVLREGTQQRPPLFLSTLVCAPCTSLLSTSIKINVSISGAEARGGKGTQLALLSSHSRLPRLLSISRIFSNYIYTSQHPHTAAQTHYTHTRRLGSWVDCLLLETRGICLSGSLGGICITAHRTVAVKVATIKWLFTQKNNTCCESLLPFLIIVIESINNNDFFWFAIKMSVAFKHKW